MNNNLPNITWINLDSSEQRREDMQVQMHFLNIPNQRFSALHPENMERYFQITWDDESLNDVKITPQTAKEIACTCSHIQAAIEADEQLGEHEDDFIVMMEDDIVMPYRIDFRKVVEKAPPEWEILQISYMKHIIDFYEETKESGVMWEQIARTESLFGTGCYILKRSKVIPIFKQWKRNGLHFESQSQTWKWDLKLYPTFTSFAFKIPLVTFSLPESNIRDELPPVLVKAPKDINKVRHSPFYEYNLQPFDSRVIQDLGEFIQHYMTKMNAQEVIWIPNPGNAGDALIALGTMHFFETERIKYTIHDYKWVKEHQEPTLILYGGGGNLTPDYTAMKDCIKNTLQPTDQGILLPHTVADAKFIEEIPENLQVICRERISYMGCYEKSPFPEHIHLHHDMAYFTDIRKLQFDNQTLQDHPLICFRTDKEAVESLQTGMFTNQLNKDISKEYKDVKNSDIEYIQKTANQFLQTIYEHRNHQVFTNRLHVSLGAVLVGIKEIKFFNNSYYKNQAVFNFSMNNERVSFVSQEQSKHELKRLEQNLEIKHELEQQNKEDHENQEQIQVETTSGGLNTTQIILISVFSVVIVALIIFLAIWFSKKRTH